MLGTMQVAQASCRSSVKLEERMLRRVTMQMLVSSLQSMLIHFGHMKKESLPRSAI